MNTFTMARQSCIQESLPSYFDHSLVNNLEEFLLDIEGIENGTVMSLEDEAFEDACFVPVMPLRNKLAPATTIKRQSNKLMGSLTSINTASSGNEQTNSGETHQQFLRLDSSDSSFCQQQQFFKMPQQGGGWSAQPNPSQGSFAHPMVLYPNPSTFIPLHRELPLAYNLTAQEDRGQSPLLIDRRQSALLRYRQKRMKRIVDGGVRRKIRYTLRKINADSRPRVKGRFIKKGDIVPDFCSIPAGETTESEEELEEGDDSS